MKRLILVGVLAFSGCHWNEAAREFDAQRAAKLALELGQLAPRAVAGDPTAIIPAIHSGWELATLIGGFVATAIGGAAAGHKVGKSRERKKRKNAQAFAAKVTAAPTTTTSA